MSRDRVEVLPLGVVPEPAVPSASLFHTEHRAFLIFNAVRPGADGRLAEAGIAVLTFDQTRLSKFGLPNDEALRGHPILGGLNVGYAVCEIHESSWLAEAMRRNEICFPGSTMFAGVRHFAVLTHDSTFECLAKSLTLRVSKEPYGVVLQELVDGGTENAG